MGPQPGENPENPRFSDADPGGAEGDPDPGGAEGDPDPGGASEVFDTMVTSAHAPHTCVVRVRV